MPSFPQMTQLFKILVFIQKLYHILPLNIESNANTVLETFERSNLKGFAKSEIFL